MQSEDVDGGTLDTWTAEEVNSALEAGKIVVIDVRTVQEYSFEHIEGAMLMPMSHFKAGALLGQSDKQIVFHCGSGVRSEKVARAALDAGLGKIAHMGGGFAAWKSAALPHIGTDMATGGPKRVG